MVLDCGSHQAQNSLHRHGCIHCRSTGLEDVAPRLAANGVLATTMYLLEYLAVRPSL